MTTEGPREPKAAGQDDRAIPAAPQTAHFRLIFRSVTCDILLYEWCWVCPSAPFTPPVLA